MKRTFAAQNCLMDGVYCGLVYGVIARCVMSVLNVIGGKTYE